MLKNFRGGGVGWVDRFLRVVEKFQGGLRFFFLEGGLRIFLEGFGIFREGLIFFWESLNFFFGRS